MRTRGAHRECPAPDPGPGEALHSLGRLTLTGAVGNKRKGAEPDAKAQLEGPKAGTDVPFPSKTTNSGPFG